MTPKVSVIVPCYNQARFLEETLLSVKTQTFTNWECIIVDDGSTDNSKKLSLHWCESDKRFKYFYKNNGGLSSARNYGLNKAIGSYVQFLDSDDLIHPEKFETQLKDLKESEISISNYFSFIDGTDNAAPHRYLSPFLSEENYKREIIWDWEYRKSIPCHTVLFDKKLIEKHKLTFNENLPNHEDWVFWSQLFYFSKSISNNKAELARYRIHNRSMSVDYRLMRRGFLKAAKDLKYFFKSQNEKELALLCKAKYKEIYNRGRVPFLKLLKSKIYSKLVPIYRYVKKN